METLLPVVLDFETFYDKSYSLKKLPTLEYVRSPQFHVHGASVKVGADQPQWISGADLFFFLEDLMWGRVELICHNTYFDGLVLYTHYGHVPARYADTMAMAQALFPFESSALDHICRLLGGPGKIAGTLDSLAGVRNLSPEQEAKLARYALRDLEITEFIYRKLVCALPESELELIDLTCRWGCIPRLEIDATKMRRVLNAALKLRRRRIKAGGVPISVLQSNPKFAAELKRRGLSVPMKPKKRKGIETNEQTWALAKNDPGFKELIADYPEHRALFEARLAAKSNIIVTRAERLLNIHGDGYGTLPMPLKYAGAHTMRWSGRDGLNPQNFPKQGGFRRAIVAPRGKVVLVADLKQIELRMNFWFCGEADWLEVIRGGRDIYTANAADYFNTPYEQVTKQQRFFGKGLELGLGYQMSWRRFRREQGLQGNFLSEEEAIRAVNHYRNTHRFITAMWTQLSQRIFDMYGGAAFALRCIEFRHEGIVLPNQMTLHYPNLTPHENEFGGVDWTYGRPNYPKKIYGGLLLENIIQALARIVIAEQMLEIVHELPEVEIVSSTHDEIIALTPRDKAPESLHNVLEIMSRPRAWCPEVPLEGEGVFARGYVKP